MTSPSVSVEAGITASASSASQTLSITSLSNNNLLIVAAACSKSSSAPAVSTVACTGLVFSKLGSVSLPGVVGQFADQEMRGEIWFAPLPVAGTYSVTVTWAAQPTCYGMNLLAIADTFDITSGFDDNPSLPATATSANTAATVTYSTTRADDLLLILDIHPLGFTNSAPSGWSTASTPGATLGSGNVSLTNLLYQKSISAAQTSQTVADGSGGPYGEIAMVFALTADAKARALQTFVTIICS